jgi:hypothetical protein
VEPLPEDVRQFLDTAIQSVDQLEILRLLGENPVRAWTADELAPEVQASPEVVAQDLTALQSRGLIALEQGATGPVWRHGPHTPELEARLGRFLQLYRERPVSMIKAVYNRPDDVLRSFADAFRLRKKED